jgi:hypothetical protein
VSEMMINLSGYRTGGLVTAQAVTHSFAFDLTGVDLQHRTVCSAVFHLADGLRGSSGSTICLTDRSQQLFYGRGEIGNETRDVRVPLNANARTDLQAAADSFFCIDAEITDEAGQPQAFPEALRYDLALRLVWSNADAGAPPVRMTS